MQSLRSHLHRVPTQIIRQKPYIHKPQSHTITRKMSLFPRFTHEFAPLFRLMDEYDRDFRRFNKDTASQLRSFTPKFDVKEVRDAYELHGEFPGIKQEDISIEWTDANTLTVSGRSETVREEGERPTGFLENGEKRQKIDKEHQPRVEDEAAESSKEISHRPNQEVARAEDAPKYWVSERSVGEFHRSFSFPARVDQDNVKASLKNGILSIVVPKAKRAEPRKIAIE
jgi:HSP20 family protein